MIKKLLIIAVCLLSSLNVWSQKIQILEASGWFESAYIKWLPVENADSYRVYYSGEGISEQRIDDQLIRRYENFVRADVIGLRKGNYTIRVAPVVSGLEGEGTVSDVLPVEAHDRSGFAFSNGRVPGAYKLDGTEKEGAVVLYITENSKNSIALDVAGANSNPCIGLQEILDGFKKGIDNRPLIIRLIGQITDPEYLLNGDLVVENKNNPSGSITIEGVGDDAVADGWGIRVKNASNVEIRNLGTMNCNSDEGDNIGLQQDNNHIWVHHCDFFYGDAGSDADQIKGDGALDCKKSTYVTFSYNHFWDSGKSNLLGLSEGTTQGLYITFHHNWYDHSDSRHPRVRYYSAHVYNNYYDGNSKYGIGVTTGASVFAEGNYFRKCKYPMLTSMQGSDVYNETTNANDYAKMPVFSKEDGGTIKAFNNYISGHKRFVSYGAAGYPSSKVDFDAIVVQNRADQIGDSVVSNFGKNRYSNFDTNAAVMYAYSADSPEIAREKVIGFAGRMNGGDLKWEFNNAVDDASSSVNSGLKAALVNYRTQLISIQGDSAAVNSDPDNGGQVFSAADLIQNFTASGLTSKFYTITGNLSDSKGSVNYDGLLLTQCLKIESGTKISFTTSEEATLTLVFNDGFSGRINLNGTSYPATGGILSLKLQAGVQVLSKTDTGNLYYMRIAYSPTSVLRTKLNKPILYPNPVENALSISNISGLQQIEFFNLSGVLVKRMNGKTNRIDLTDLKSGNYLVKIYAENRVFTQKIRKQ